MATPTAIAAHDHRGARRLASSGTVARPVTIPMASAVGEPGTMVSAW
jgi:hypothetical protein